MTDNEEKKTLTNREKSVIIKFVGRRIIFRCGVALSLVHKWRGVCQVITFVRGSRWNWLNSSIGYYKLKQESCQDRTFVRFLTALFLYSSWQVEHLFDFTNWNL